MSWSSAASRTTGRSAGAASTVRSVWSQRSSPGILFWGIPRWAARSGEIGASRPVSLSSRSPTDGTGARQQLVELGGDPLARQVGDELGACLDRRPASPARSRSRASPPAGPPGPSGARPPRTAPADRRRRAGRRPRTSARPPYGSTSAGRLARPGAPGHRVDREVAAGEVELDRVAELDPVRPPEVGVVVVGPEGRDLERPRRRAGRATVPNAVLVDRAREELDDPFGQGVRGEVPVGGRPAEEDVAQRPADDVGGVAARPERLEQVADGRRDRAVDGVRPTGRGRQLRPRKRYVRHASLRSSARYGVNSE